MDLPPLHLLRTFEASARRSSFTGASQELGISQAAVSQQIRQLESWLGRRIFRREGRGVRLSPAGAELFQAVASGFGLIAAAGQRLRSPPGSMTLTVGCIPSVALRWLIPNLADFQRIEPAAEVRVVYATAGQAFDPDDLDILVTLAEAGPPGTRTQPLFSRRNRPVASALLVDRDPGLLHPGGLAEAPLLHDASTAGWADWFGRAGLIRLTPPRGPVFQDFHLLATAALAGQGVALCPVEVFRQEIARGELIVLSEVETDADQSYVMISDGAARPLADSFARWFADICRPPRAQAPCDRE